MKSLLIISPSFPPANAADMHRVRQSVHYFEEMGWKPTVVMVDTAYSEYPLDPLLEQGLPPGLEIIRINALAARWTRRVGLGNLGYRSLWFYFQTVNRLLQTRRFDLVYFSTTMFPVMVLGAYWKKRFGIPYVIDMQDPWLGRHYKAVPKHERLPKAWFAYYMSRLLEPIAIKSVDGIVSVSEGYCRTLQGRYPSVRPENCTVIPFGAFPADFDVLGRHPFHNPFFNPHDGNLHVVYVGRGGHDMAFSARVIFRALHLGRQKAPHLFGRVRMHFIGTSYAPGNQGKPTLKPVADAEGVGEQVQEHPARVPYFDTLHLLHAAHMLVVPGSADPNYTASKLYPYILARKPLLVVFNQKSSVVEILDKTRAGSHVAFGEDGDADTLGSDFLTLWEAMLHRLPFIPDTDWAAFEPYTAREMTRRQCLFFEQVLEKPCFYRQDEASAPVSILSSKT